MHERKPVRPVQEIVALTADPRALEPNTIRQVLREYDILNTKEGNDLTFFLDCVTIRNLIARGETGRAALVAEQIGLTLADFTPTNTTDETMAQVSDTNHEGEVCQHCGEPAVFLTCWACGIQAWIIDCGHQAQPRPLAIGKNDATYMHRIFCADCAARP